MVEERSWNERVCWGVVGRSIFIFSVNLSSKRTEKIGPLSLSLCVWHCLGLACRCHSETDEESMSEWAAKNNNSCCYHFDTCHCPTTKRLKKNYRNEHAHVKCKIYTKKEFLSMSLIINFFYQILFRWRNYLI